MGAGCGGACACACAPGTLAGVAPERLGENPGGPDTCAVIVAGGSGERFGGARAKQFVELCGLPMVCWSLVAFDRAPSVAETVLVCSPEHFDEVREGVFGCVALNKPVVLAPGGSTRQESVMSGLSVVPRELAYTAVHDAARPLIEVEQIEAVIAAVREDPRLAGAILAARAVDTLKLVEGTQIVATPDRAFYWAAQTPQVFRTKTLVAAHKAALWDDFAGTDDASLVERHGGRVRVVEGSMENLKVTVPLDLAIAEATLEQRLVDAGCGA